MDSDRVGRLTEIWQHADLCLLPGQAPATQYWMCRLLVCELLRKQLFVVIASAIQRR